MKLNLRGMVSLFIILILIFGVHTKNPVRAESTIQLTALNTPYQQDFDSMSNTNESGILPTGWKIGETGENSNNLYSVGYGFFNIADTYSFGATDSTDRALGSIQSDTFTPIFGASFTNNTNGTINSLTIRYTGEQWRSGKTSHIDRLAFEISTNATSLADGTWVDGFDLLDFKTLNSSSVGYKNGNDTSFRSTLAYTITGLSIANGKSFWIRWRDINATGFDDGLAVDDFSLTPSGSDLAPSVTSITPVDGSVDVAVAADISVTFSEPVNLESGWFILDCTDSGLHAATEITSSQVYDVNPDEDFINGETCEFTVLANNVRDQDASDPPDNLGNNLSITFTIIQPPDDAPVVKDSRPVNGEKDVALESDLNVKFSEPVAVGTNLFTLVCSISGTHEATVTGEYDTYVISPNSPFIYDEDCTLTLISQEVMDLDDVDPPDTMTADFELTFSTLSTPDPAPYVIRTSPANHATDVAIDQDVVITFSEPVTTLKGWFEIQCEETGSHDALVTGEPIIYILSPDVVFGNDETCTVKVNSQKVNDSDEDDPYDTMAMNEEISFTTIPIQDDAPSIKNSIPASGDEAVPIDSSITIQFSEPVTLSGNWYTLTCSISGSHTAHFIEVSENVVINPESDFANSETCTLTIQSQLVTDQDLIDPPDNLIADHVIQFTTAAPSDIAPTVVETSPANDAIEVPITGQLSITFSEPVTLLPGWIDFTCTSSGDHYVFLYGGPIKFTLDPDSAFDYDDTCEITLKASRISDQDKIDDPDKMDDDYSFTFTTLPDPESLIYPIVVAGGQTNPIDGQRITNATNRLTVQFSKEVLHDNSEDAANNPDNYRLYWSGQNNIAEFQTCELNEGDDIQISIDHVDYFISSHTAVLSVNQGTNLANGIYRLIVCGAHTIRDLYGNAINNGSNSIITFTVSVASSESGGTGGSSGTGSSSGTTTTTSTPTPKTITTTSGLFIPVTGFAPGRVTLVPRQTTTYSEMGSLWLEIPSMDLEMSIVGVPFENGKWDISWLSSQAGWLTGSAFPTFEGNSVLTAHVWDAYNQPGPFYGVEELQYGDEVIIHAWGEEYVYKVREIKSVSPHNVAAMLKHQTTPWLTLVTCQDYDEKSDTYQHRILVRAVLVEVR